MCGIAGYVGKGSEADLTNMIASIQYRGPDYQGVSVKNNVGFAHARLSIIDLSATANQPFLSSDGKYAITFNGEIYNYLTLKSELLKTGRYSFRTDSDTEVLLYAYIEYGINCLQKIQGMFAFGIYDFEKEQLLLAKDRMGKKPLYYSVIDGTIVFASELKAVVKHPAVRKEMNLNALNQYLTFNYVPTPDSIFTNVYKLEAAHYLLFKNQAIEKHESYWSVSFDEAQITFTEASQRLDYLLNEAVAKRLVSDVPLGVFLSGGLDSSAVAYYAQKNSRQKIKTFSIGFEEKGYDESSYARLVANKLGTEHHEQILTAKESLEILPTIVSKLDEPFADASIIPTYFLSKFTRQQVTVALGGDGSDELFAGYPTFIADRFAKPFQYLPKSVISLIMGMADMLPATDQNISFDFKAKQFLKGFEGNKKYRHALWLGAFTPALKQELFTPQALSKISNGNGLACIDRYEKEAGSATDFNRMLYTYYRSYLQDDILVKVDRASMYNSLEVRAPFLDTEVVEFANSLPKGFKIKGGNVKVLLKNLMRDKIPIEIIDRPKKGFGIPISLWLKNELKELCADVLSYKRIDEAGIFNPMLVQKLMQEHFSGKANNRMLLWNLMIFELWKREFAE